MGLFQKASMATARCTIAGWVFAASLFVVTTIAEVRSPKLGSVAKAHLAELRFPSYYVFGFGLLAIASVTSVVAFRQPNAGTGRFRAIIILLGLSLAFITADYLWIFSPLLEMTTNVQEARPANFQTYHRLSMGINSACLVTSLAASIVTSWPVSVMAKKEPAEAGSES